MLHTASVRAVLCLCMRSCPRYPNGCSYLDAGKRSAWREDKQATEGIRPWVMWHAACLQGLQQKGKAMQGLLELRARALGEPRGQQTYALGES